MKHLRVFSSVAASLLVASRLFSQFVVPGGITNIGDSGNGRVGIGTAAPASALDVRGDVLAGGVSWTGYYTSANGATATLRISDPGSYGSPVGFVGTDTNTPFMIRAAAQPVAWFAPNGNVGIGAMYPTAKLQLGITNLWNVNEGVELARLGGATSRFSFKLKSDASGYYRGALEFTQNGGTVSEVISIGNEALGNGGASNVGIGTTTPSARLEVHGAPSHDVPIIAKSQTNNCYLSLFNAGGDNSISSSGNSLFVGGGGTAGPVYFRNGWNVNLAVTATGRVGIGTTVPYSPFEVLVAGGNNEVALGQYIGRRTSGTAAAGLGVSSRFYLQDAGGSSIETNGIASVWTDPSTAARAARMDFYSSKNNVSYVAMSLDASGNLGIGTTNPTNKLEVNGTIRTKEVIVETNGWADHVLAKGYPLAPLSEVEAHIAATGTLPGIPSAAEVAEKGVSVGDMQARLLAKLEELTLHVIEQQKQIDQLRRENASIRAQALSAVQIP